MYNPVCTYRLQFHKGFTFKDLKRILPYLDDLGVKTIYASPIFEAVPGSNHGYDVVNPHRINPEIGTMSELEEISATLKKCGIGWLQDIVPNHMAFHPTNCWLMDVLEKGQSSPYVDFFDIQWDVPGFEGKLMVPFLGRPLPDLIKDGEIRLSWDNDGLSLRYAEQRYPVNLNTYTRLLQFADGTHPADIQHPQTGNPITDLIQNKLQALNFKPAVKNRIESAIELINNDPKRLLEIADEQFYRLAFWKKTDRAINYRRFFTVNSLICLNMQNEDVFRYYHRLIKELLDRGIFQGLRVDHIDGLYDPAGYLQQLRKLAGPQTYVVVEKILKSGEKLPTDWPVQGNTGYDFLAIVNNLLTCAESKKQFTDFYAQHFDSGQPLESAVHEKKADILYRHMAGELENLYRLFVGICPLPKKQLQKIAPEDLKAAIAEFLIRCPVYRFYGNRIPLSRPERGAVDQLLDSIETAKPELGDAVKLLKDVFIRPPAIREERDKVLRFYRRCMQFTGPLMAKGVEDTLMYTYERFISHNEVGDSPAAFGLHISTFYQLMTKRQTDWPLSLNATSTHDTKRGEDVRAKLNVLTDIGLTWLQTVADWQDRFAKFKTNGAPDANDAYLIYQTLAGAAALPGQQEDQLPERLAEYLTKALREGKVHSQWDEPDTDYEQATLAFTSKLLEPRSRFRKSLEALQAKVADHFIVNSLVQLLLKFTCPGTPDIYQGCELWDYSLVDPDNRRPVDYGMRIQQLKKVRTYDLSTLWASRYNGSVKLWLTDHLMHARGQHPALFSKGVYFPFSVTGKYQQHIVAFGRRHLRKWLIVIAPLHLAKITDEPLNFDWEDTAVILPDDAPVQWKAAFTEEKSMFNGRISVGQVLGRFPVALLLSQAVNTRTAGIIMHITSLPSRFGIGDLGPAARLFADFLADAGQSYWQLLPVNPTGPAAGYSPYSSFSSMAGNTLLISPDDLVQDGLLGPEQAARYELSETGTVNFESAQNLKQKLFDLAYDNFISRAPSEAFEAFDSFKIKESIWLNDFAQYVTLKAHHDGLPWYEWGAAFKCRNEHALASFRRVHEREIDYTKWLQFIFFRQWQRLKAYGNNLGLRFFGDLPFYVSYDSADVWTHPEIFSLDNHKNMAGLAGVPPDYFNASGQLWGMPVYCWDKLADSGYRWWIDRMKKNREFFDVIRLDHFRAFYDYWEVPATESTAINGCWKPGPGAAIFDAFKESLGELPFIAEDLGDVSPGVYELRDQVGLPGMNLLQYAFGDDMPVSIHIPHNHVANSVTYTGTHDNNTTLGWYKQDTTALERQRLAGYLRTKVNRRNVTPLLIELCYASVSAIAIVPLQDVLGLDADARMNKPSTKNGNWSWQLRSRQLQPKAAALLRRFCKIYNR